MHSKSMPKPLVKSSNSDMIKRQNSALQNVTAFVCCNHKMHSFTWPAKPTGMCALIHTELLGKERKKVSFFFLTKS